MGEKRTHAERLDRLYRLIVLSAQARDNLRAAYNAYNRYINDMIRLYRKAGGRRSLSQYVKEDI